MQRHRSNETESDRDERGVSREIAERTNRALIELHQQDPFIRNKPCLWTGDSVDQNDEYYSMRRLNNDPDIFITSVITWIEPWYHRKWKIGLKYHHYRDEEQPEGIWRLFRYYKFNQGVLCVDYVRPAE